MNTATLLISRPNDEPLDKPFVPDDVSRARSVDRSAPSTADSQEPRRGGLLMLASLIVLVWAAWQFSRLGLFKPKDDISYWIAVTGGSMMVLLFTFPLRKHVRFMQGLGRVKWWFWTHLFLGIAGPWLILVHSGFHSASLNAGVALYSMVIVVCSGVIGLCIYTNVHRGLHGERTSLQDLNRRAGFVETDARSKLHFAPRVEERLRAFEAQGVRVGWASHLRQVTLLPVQQLVTYVRCVIELRHPLHELAEKYHWSEDQLQRHERRARRLVGRYLNAVVRVAQYTAFERLFALWHVAHLPFVYLMVISAVVHVIAVHAY